MMDLDVKKLTVPKRIELAVAVLLLVYATLGIHYLKDVDSYMDFFEHKGVRILAVALVCAVGYANPRLGVLLAVCLFRTVDIVAERFEVIEVNPRNPPKQLIGTDGAVHELATPGRFNSEQLEKGHVQVLEDAGDHTDKVTSELMGLKYSEGPDEVSLDSQFSQSLAAGPEARVSSAPVPVASAEAVSVVVEPVVDRPMVDASNVDDVSGPAPGAPATVPMGSAAPSMQVANESEMSEAFGW